MSFPVEEHRSVVARQITDELNEYTTILTLEERLILRLKKRLDYLYHIVRPMLERDTPIWKQGYEHYVVNRIPVHLWSDEIIGIIIDAEENLEQFKEQLKQKVRATNEQSVSPYYILSNINDFPPHPNAPNGSNPLHTNFCIAQIWNRVNGYRTYIVGYDFRFNQHPFEYFYFQSIPDRNNCDLETFKAALVDIADHRVFSYITRP